MRLEGCRWLTQVHLELSRACDHLRPTQNERVMHTCRDTSAETSITTLKIDRGLSMDQALQKLRDAAEAAKMRRREHRHTRREEQQQGASPSGQGHRLGSGGGEAAAASGVGSSSGGGGGGGGGSGSGSGSGGARPNDGRTGNNNVRNNSVLGVSGTQSANDAGTNMGQSLVGVEGSVDGTGGGNGGVTRTLGLLDAFGTELSRDDLVSVVDGDTTELLTATCIDRKADNVRVEVTGGLYVGENIGGLLELEMEPMTSVGSLVELPPDRILVQSTIARLADVSKQLRRLKVPELRQSLQSQRKDTDNLRKPELVQRLAAMTVLQELRAMVREREREREREAHCSSHCAHSYYIPCVMLFFTLLFPSVSRQFAAGSAATP